MGDLQQRIFAMSGAILFFLTSIGLTVVVVVTMIQDSKKPKADPAADLQANACQIEEVSGEPLPLPTETFTAGEKIEELQTTDLVEGDGQEAKAGDCLNMKYYGTLASDGVVFDENFSKDKALQFSLGKQQVIPGWDQGLIGIKEGGTRRLVIPSSLAYGEQGQGGIPPNADLVFIVKLVEIKE